MEFSSSAIEVQEYHGAKSMLNACQVATGRDLVHPLIPFLQ